MMTVMELFGVNSPLTDLNTTFHYFLTGRCLSTLCLAYWLLVGRHNPSLWSHWYPYFGFLVTSTLFKQSQSEPCISIQQECIPVWCVPSAAVAVTGEWEVSAQKWGLLRRCLLTGCVLRSVCPEVSVCPTGGGSLPGDICPGDVYLPPMDRQTPLKT